MPFTTYSGWLLPVRDVMPRITTLLAPLGPVPTPLTLTPATLPSSPFTKLFSRASVSVTPFTSDTEYPSFRRSFCMPKAVTITLFNCAEDSCSFTSMVAWSPTFTSSSWKPTNENTRVAVLAADMENLPFASVTVTVFVPLTLTVTPEIGWLSTVLVTVPLIILSAKGLRAKELMLWVSIKSNNKAVHFVNNG